jgi:hypothetical protein
VRLDSFIVRPPGQVGRRSGTIGGKKGFNLREAMRLKEDPFAYHDVLVSRFGFGSVCFQETMLTRDNLCRKRFKGLLGKS